MTWAAMLTDEAAFRQIETDHRPTFNEWMRRRRDKIAQRFSWVLWQKGYTSGWWDAVQWVLHLQARYDELTAEEAICELRKGPGSIYWPIKMDDPTIWVDCPAGHRTLVGVEAICDEHGIEVLP